MGRKGREALSPAWEGTPLGASCVRELLWSALTVCACVCVCARVCACAFMCVRVSACGVLTEAGQHGGRGGSVRVSTGEGLGVPELCQDLVLYSPMLALHMVTYGPLQLPSVQTQLLLILVGLQAALSPGSGR